MSHTALHSTIRDIRSVTGNDEKYKTRVPISGNYEITGDNKDAFIITALKNE